MENSTKRGLEREVALQLIIKTIFWSVTIFVLVFTLYSVYRVKRIRRKKYSRLGQPYVGIYRNFISMPFISGIVDRYEKLLRFIYASETSSKAAISVYCVLLPCISYLEIVGVLTMVKVWYFSIPILAFSLVLPFLIITNNILKKSMNLRYKLLKYYESAERFYADNLQTHEVFENVAAISTGPIRKIFESFCDTYQIDKYKAYEDFYGSVGDKYSESFIASVIKYDEEGKNPCEEIRKHRTIASLHYQLRNGSYEVFSAFKVVVVILLFIVVGMGIGSTKVTDTMGSAEFMPVLTYIGLGIIGISLVLDLLYERRSVE